MSGARLISVSLTLSIPETSNFSLEAKRDPAFSRILVPLTRTNSYSVGSERTPVASHKIPSIEERHGRNKNRRPPTLLTKPSSSTDPEKELADFALLNLLIN